MFLVMAAVLPLSALLARRLPLGSVVKMALAWAAVFAVGLVIVGQREMLRPLYDGAVRALTGDDQQVVGRAVRIAVSLDGHYWATATINGVRRRMLIDSGATVTALSQATAHAAGVPVETGQFGEMIETANGTVVADRARIRELRLGALVARDFAVVIAPAFGDTDVLGMNFLSQLGGWRVEGSTLILEPRQTDMNFT